MLRKIPFRKLAQKQTRPDISALISHISEVVSLELKSLIFWRKKVKRQKM